MYKQNHWIETYLFALVVYPHNDRHEVFKIIAYCKPKKKLENVPNLSTQTKYFDTMTTQKNRYISADVLLHFLEYFPYNCSVQTRSC